MGEKNISTMAEDYIERFYSRSRRRRSVELSRQIKEAQESADHVSLERLLREKNRLLQEKNLGQIKGRA